LLDPRSFCEAANPAQIIAHRPSVFPASKTKAQVILRSDRVRPVVDADCSLDSCEKSEPQISTFSATSSVQFSARRFIFLLTANLFEEAHIFDVAEPLNGKLKFVDPLAETLAATKSDQNQNESQKRGNTESENNVQMVGFEPAPKEFRG
jgi:hypothetical protein